jgi:hypothetical protein
LVHNRNRTIFSAIKIIIMAIDIITYVRAKSTNEDEISQLDIKTHVPTPDENDYEVGYIVRYFLQKVNDSDATIYEISNYFQDVVESNGLYKIQSIKWRIIGIPQDIMDSNKKSISLALENMPKLSLYLPNLLQFAKIK